MKWAVAWALIASLIPLDAAAQASDQQLYGSLVMPTGVQCSVYVEHYGADQSDVRILARMILPDGRKVSGPAIAAIGDWRRNMYPWGNRPFTRFI